MTYVQFLEARDRENPIVDGKFIGMKEIVEAMGSDGIFILDERNTLHTQECDAHLRMDKMNAGLNKGWIGWCIRKGDRLDTSKPIKLWIRSGAVDVDSYDFYRKEINY